MTKIYSAVDIYRKVCSSSERIINCVNKRSKNLDELGLKEFWGTDYNRYTNSINVTNTTHIRTDNTQNKKIVENPSLIQKFLQSLLNTLVFTLIMYVSYHYIGVFVAEKIWPPQQASTEPVLPVSSYLFDAYHGKDLPNGKFRPSYNEEDSEF